MEKRLMSDPKPPKTVHMIVGVPGSGKSWVAEQLNQFDHKPHDSYPVSDYHKELITHSKQASKDILAEAPFRASVLIDQLKAAGIPVKTYYISEPEQKIRQQYEARSKKQWPKQNLTNLKKYDQRPDWDHKGNSNQILDILKKIKGL